MALWKPKYSWKDWEVWIREKKSIHFSLQYLVNPRWWEKPVLHTYRDHAEHSTPIPRPWHLVNPHLGANKTFQHHLAHARILKLKVVDEGRPGVYRSSRQANLQSPEQGIPALWMATYLRSEEWFCLGEEATLWFSTRGPLCRDVGNCMGVFLVLFVCFRFVVMMTTRYLWNLEAMAPNTLKGPDQSCTMKCCLAPNAKSTSTEHRPRPWVQLRWTSRGRSHEYWCKV